MIRRGFLAATAAAIAATARMVAGRCIEVGNKLNYFAPTWSPPGETPCPPSQPQSYKRVCKELASAGVKVPAPRKNVIRKGMHSHVCGACRNEFWHYNGSHMCPACGRGPWYRITRYA